MNTFDQNIATLRERVDHAPEWQPKVAELPKLPFRTMAELLANPHVPRWLQRKILEASVIALLVGRRGSYKSFIATDWAMRIAADGKPVVLISPEGAGLANRIAAWMQIHGEGIDPATMKLCIIEVRVDIADSGTLEALHNTIAAWGETPALIVIDTVSKNSGRLDENSNSEVKTYIGRLDTELRARYSATVLAVHHTGHDNIGRARGASAFEADVEALYIVARDGTSKTVTVSRERFKDSEELPPLAYEASVVDLGRLDEDGEPITSLALNRIDAPPVAAKSKGPNQAKAITALREWMRNHPDADHIASADMTALLKAHGMNRQRRPEVLNFLVNARILTPSIGGHTLDRSML